MYTLYYTSGAANMAPHAALEEIGAPFTLVPIDIAGGEHKRRPYLDLNPHGRVPTLVDGETVIYEAAAIVMHLADKHPEAGLAPAPATAERGRYYQWLLFLSNSVQPSFAEFFHPERHMASPAGQAEIKAQAEKALDGMWDRIDAAMAPGPYLLGARFSACDLYLFMLARWCRHLSRPAMALSRPHVERCARLVRDRPAVQRMLRSEGLAFNPPD